jgi:type II secretory pathway component PulL
MMKSRTWMLVVGRTRWQLYAGSEGGAPLADEAFAPTELMPQAESAFTAFTSHAYCGEPIVLALESHWCLAATLTVDRPQQFRDRQTLLYRLEESIPWSIEDCVCDYVTSGTKALMVAAPCNPLAEFLTRLEQLGANIQTIAPSALLAAAAHVRRGDWPREHTIAIHQNDTIDLISMAAQKPVSWSWLPAAGDALSHEFAHSILETGSAIQLIPYALDDAVLTKLERSGSIKIIERRTEATAQPSTLALTAAEKILGGQWDTPIELKQGAFGRTRGNRALRRYTLAVKCALTVLLIATSLVLLHRANVAGRHAALLAAQQTEEFKKMFPNTKVPTGIRSRLESELAKLKGLQGDDSSIPRIEPAPTLLHRTLAAMPTDRRFRLHELRIEEGRLYIDGEVRDHSDAEAIAQQLRAQGFDVPPPRTQRLDERRVSLRVTGTLTRPSTVALRKAS